MSHRRLLIIVNLLLVGLTALTIGLVSLLLLMRESQQHALQISELKASLAHAALEQIPRELLTSASILSNRPTLARLLRQDDMEPLQPYLQAFRNASELDFIAIQEHSDSISLNGSVPDPKLLQHMLELASPTLWWLDQRNDGGHILAVASAPLSIADHPHAQVLVGKRLQQRDLDALSAQLGVTLQVLTRQQLATAPEQSVQRQLLYAEQLLSRESDNGEQYIAGLPLFSRDDIMLAAVLVQLPANEFVQARQALLERWASSVLLLMLLALSIAIYSSHRLAQPVRQLTKAAERLARADFSTPIPVLRDRDHGLLAETLENSRQKILAMTTRLRQLGAEAGLLLDTINEGVFAVDTDRRIRFLNPAAERMLGTSNDDASGRFCGDILQPVSVDGVRPCDHDCPILKARSGSSVRATEHLQLHDNCHSVVIHSSVPAGGRQVQILRHETRAESGRRLRDAVIANVSHEFKTPLAAIVAAVELLESSVASPNGEASTLIDSIQRASIRLQQLIDNLLESVSIDSHADALNLAPVSLQLLLDECAALIRPLLLQKQQQLAIDIQTGLTEIIVDTPRMLQVLTNLLSNAIKYSPEHTTIQLRAYQDKSMIYLELQDQGPGLNADTEQSIFQRFYRSPGLSAGESGMGLGLWIVDSIIRRHGGSISASNLPRGGSCFCISLPGGEQS